MRVWQRMQSEDGGVIGNRRMTAARTFLVAVTMSLVNANREGNGMVCSSAVTFY
jgi:hypothetical protein